jgi:ABC-type uncharacterized transport system fused permease/ATPase subunit
VLKAVGLSRLAGKLSEAGHWALQLSPGEQQHIAFARALVQKPDWLFLDEATSAVDETTEARLYRLVRERLKGTTVFSVGPSRDVACVLFSALYRKGQWEWTFLHRGSDRHARTRST